MRAIILCHHHTNLKHGLKELVAAVPDAAVIGTTAPPAALLAQCTSARWDVALLDLTQAVDEAFDVIRAFRRQRPDLRLIVTSAVTQPDHIRHCLRLGIRGYLAAQDGPGESGRAVSAVLAGAVYLSRAAARALSTDPPPSAV